MKKIGFCALSLFFFVTLSIAVIMLTNVFFNRQTTFFERNTNGIQEFVTQMENR